MGLKLLKKKLGKGANHWGGEDNTEATKDQINASAEKFCRWVNPEVATGKISRAKKFRKKQIWKRQKSFSRGGKKKQKWKKVGVVGKPLSARGFGGRKPDQSTMRETRGKTTREGGLE